MTIVCCFTNNFSLFYCCCISPNSVLLMPTTPTIETTSFYCKFRLSLQRVHFVTIFVTVKSKCRRLTFKPERYLLNTELDTISWLSELSTSCQQVALLRKQMYINDYFIGLRCLFYYVWIIFVVHLSRFSNIPNTIWLFALRQTFVTYSFFILFPF